MTNKTEIGFIHPLSSIDTINTSEGKKEVINSWAFASMIWSAALKGNENALGIANELFTDKNEMTSCLEASKNRNQGAIRSAIAIMAFAIDEKIQQRFDENDTI